MKKRKHPGPRNTVANANKNTGAAQQSIPPEVLETVPEGTRTAMVQAASFSGPLPPPALYEQYEEVLPGSAERIMAMTEREQEQRHTWDNRVVEVQNGEISRGQWLGFVLGAGAIVGAVYCATIDQPWVATVMVGTSLAGIVTAFIKGRSGKE